MENYRTTLKKGRARYLLFLILVSACFYEPNEEYFEQIEQPSFDGFVLVVDINDDTINIDKDSQVQFSLFDNSRPRKIEQIKVYLDDEEYSENYVRISENDVIISLFTFGSGISYHNLRLEILVSPETNSLADILEAENILLEASWVIRSDNIPPEPINLNPIKFKNGVLTLEWPREADASIDQYLLVADYNDNNNEYLRRDIIEFGPNDDLLYEDRNYIGGIVNYWIVTKFDNKYLYGDTLTYSYPALDVNVQFEDDNSLTVTWPEVPFYNHDMKMSIQVKSFNYEIEEPNSQLLHTSLFPNRLAPIYVKYDFQSEDSEYSFSFNGEKTIQLSDGKLGYGGFLYSKITNSIFATGGSQPARVYKYDASTFELVSSGAMVYFSQGPRLVISKNSQYAYCYSADLRQILQFNTADLSVAKSIDIEKIVGFKTYQGSIDIANNNLAYLSATGRDKINHHYLVNLETETLEMNLGKCKSKLSWDGNFVINDTDVLKRINGKWEKVYALEYPNFFCGSHNFTLVSEAQDYYLIAFITNTDNGVVVYHWDENTSNGSTLSPVYYPTEKKLTFVNHDPISGYIVCFDKENLHLYDVKNFELKHTFRNIHGNFWNETIIARDGSYIIETLN